MTDETGILGRPAEAAPVAQAPSRRPPAILLGAITVAVLLLAWWIVAALRLVPPLFLPGPLAVLQAFVSTATDGFADASLWQHLTASLLRVFAALVLATLTAVPLGIVLGLNPVLRGLADPIIEFYRPIPPLAYLPLIVIWLGIGETAKIVIIFLAIFAPVVLATRAGVASVPEERIRVAQALGATRGQIIRLVVLPNVLPDILTGIRIGLGAGWSTLVAAELVAATRGLGFMIQSAAQFLVTDVVIMGIIVIALVALLFELALRWAERLLVPWRGRH